MDLYNQAFLFIVFFVIVFFFAAAGFWVSLYLLAWAEILPVRLESLHPKKVLAFTNIQAAFKRII
jgi:hypothetical protein